MISAKKAYSIFAKKHKDLTVTECVLYDNRFYVFTAVKNPNGMDYDDPYYAVDRNTGEISDFSPMDDLDKYLDAINNHQIDWR